MKKRSWKRKRRKRGRRRRRWRKRWRRRRKVLACKDKDLERGQRFLTHLFRIINHPSKAVAFLERFEETDHLPRG